MKHLLFIPLLLITIISCSAKEPSLNIEDMDQELLMQLGMYTQMITTYRMWEVDCSDNHPEKAKEYKSAFEGKNYALLEKSLSKLLVDPKAEWEARKNDNSFGQEYEPISLENCTEMLDGVSRFVKSFDSNEADAENFNKFIDFANEFSNLDDSEFDKILGGEK